MKQITAIIQPQMLTKVVRALHELPHFPGFTILDTRGQGRGRGIGGSFTITEENIDYHRKIMILIVCSDELQPSITDAIQTGGHTNTVGDGLIVITDVAEVIRIRTGEKQEKAL